MRAGVHAGLAWPRGDNYVALAVHQTARVVSAAHGGQVIATSAVAERAGIPIYNQAVDLLGSETTERTELRTLGRFRVRDFDEPVVLLQVIGPGLPATFPPLRVLPAEGHNLVVPPNELLGRVADLDELSALVGAVRLVSLVGTGGVGKTRLATEFGLRHAPEWKDGVWLVDLTGIAEGELIPEVIANALGAKLDGDAQPWDAVLEHLRERHSLLIVDNCEHLRVDVAKRVHALLGACPEVCVLATTREPLGLRGERVVHTQPLDLDTAALAMFAQRAGLGDVNNLDVTTRSILNELCRVLDGLPLAIELAASRCDVLSPAEILSQLERRRDLLRSRDPTLAARQRSMEATIEWSHQLLSTNEQAAFRRLGVFVDGFDLDAATRAATVDDEFSAYEAPELIWSLASKSLVASELASGTTRYRMLESIRHAARRHLEDSGETTAVAVSVAGYYLECFGPNLERLDADAIASRAREVHNLRGLITSVAAHDQELAQTLGTAVVADTRQSSFSVAIDEAKGLLDELPARTRGRLALLYQVAYLLDETQRPEEAEMVLAEADALAAVVGVPPWLDGRLDQEHGIVELLRGNPVRAREIALEGMRRVTGTRGRANLLELQMLAALELEDTAQAVAAGGEALALTQERGDPEVTSLLLSSLAEAAWRVGDHATAASRQLESLSLGLQTGRRRDIAFAYIMAARLASAQHDDAMATRLQSAADRLLVEAGASLYPTDGKLRDELLAVCRERIGAARFVDELAQGHAMEAEAAVQAAIDVLRGTVHVTLQE